MKNLKPLFSFFIISVLLLNVAYSQRPNLLVVRVVDQNSGVIAGGTARIKSLKDSSEMDAKISQGGEAKFSLWQCGDYILRVEVAGFAPFEKKISLKAGRNNIVIELDLKKIQAEVKIELDQQDRRVYESFNEHLSSKEINELSGDVEADLKQKYGEDILIQVDGFTDGGLPPKELIASVKVIKNSFDAEFHEVGRVVVKISTKAGQGRWVGTGSFSLSDFRLNARNPIAKKQLPKQNRSFFGFLGGPLVKNKTSLDLFVFGNSSFQQKNLLAVVPGRTFENDAKTSFSITNSRFGVRHNVNKNQNLILQYEFEGSGSKNLGVGELSLPEHGYSSNSESHKVRAGLDGIIAGKFVNEFRTQMRFSNDVTKPNSRDRAVIVSDAFHSGGAGIDNRASDNKLAVNNNLMFDFANQSIKLGGNFDFEQYRSFSNDSANGTFIFTNLSAFAIGRPILFRRRLGTSETEVTQIKAAVFFQDDVKFYKNLQVGFGLRYERQSILKDTNNFSPRLSFTFSPFRDGKIVFRSGVGIFYEWFEIRDAGRILSTDGRQASELIIRFPGYPEPFGSGHRSDPLAPSILRKAENLKNPYVFIFQSAFNYRVSKDFIFEGAYTFQKSANQFRSRDLNAPVDGVRPNQHLGRVAQVESQGSLARHSLKFRARGRFPKGITFNSRYELADSKDDFDGVFELPADSHNPKGDFGPASLDRRHFLNGSFNIPIFRSLRFLTLFQLGSPYPYTITTGFDNNRDSVFKDRPIGESRNTRRGAWFSQFDVQMAWDIPILNKKPVNGVGRSNTETSRLRRRALGIDVTIQNIFNRANYEGYVGNRQSPLFGQPTFAGLPRSFQFGVRFLVF